MPRKPNESGDHYNDPFPKRLRELINERDTKQEDLKSVLGVKNRQSVTGYIDGSTIPTIEKLSALAAFYGVNADYLLGLSETPAVSEDMRTAVKVTGLTEKAIENARQFCSPVNGSECERWSLLSELMETDGFCELIVDIENLYGVVGLLAEEYDAYVYREANLDSSSEDNPPVQAVLSQAERLYPPMDSLIRLYDEVRLEKYELRDAFAAILDKLIPTEEILSSVKKVLREYGGLSASSDNEGGEEHGG